MSSAYTSVVRVADPGIRGKIFALEKRRHIALMAADTGALSELLDEALVHIHAPGLAHTKAQLLEHVQKRQAYIEMRREKLKVRMIGDDVALMTGRLINRLRSPDGSERVISGMVTQVLRRGSDGVWRFINFQMTPDGEHVWPAFDSELDDHDHGDTIDTKAQTGEESP
ncbi:nuclear transport factor 2 family protein [Gordonia sp. NPDC003424]